MGKKKTYQCDSCEYNCQISAGVDFGLVAVTKTFTCLNCNEVVDVLVGQYGSVFPKDQIEEFFDPGTIIELDGFYTCPECNKSDRLKPWNSRKRPCPKCKGKMAIDPEGIVTMWD